MVPDTVAAWPSIAALQRDIGVLPHQRGPRHLLVTSDGARARIALPYRATGAMPCTRGISPDRRRPMPVRHAAAADMAGDAP